MSVQTPAVEGEIGVNMEAHHNRVSNGRTGATGGVSLRPPLGSPEVTTFKNVNMLYKIHNIKLTISSLLTSNISNSRVPSTNTVTASTSWGRGGRGSGFGGGSRGGSSSSSSNWPG